ncbi:hypothetical protein [Parasitella parasitica]|uniref:BTB domain-containing protein n=1 Tax=Parasitella parasitica TaxID=35722 RepID=A0A0B7NV30_9FUNG|nr:hypothetical protein [Parasitella parasitica]
MTYYNNNKKREYHHHNQQQQLPPPQLYIDIFEPPPQWVPSVSNANNANPQQGFHAHSPTHRSPIQHHPSLSEIVYQEYNSSSDRQDAYPGAFEPNRRSFPFALQQQRGQQQLHKTYYQEHVQFKKQQQPLQEQKGHHHHTRSNSIGSAHDFESAASSLHTVSTSPKFLQYDDIDEDIESINRSMFRNQHNHRLQADNISIATSLFTAVEHLGNDSEEEDSSSTENQRHGYVTTTAANQTPQESVNEIMKKLDIQTSIQWEDYKPQYRSVNESYDSVKQDESGQNCLPKSGKIRLNVGGGIFETSLSTLRRDTNSLLATMFSGRHFISAEPDGSYFIDRDPLHFRLVLNYLRDLRIPPTILEDTKICHELLQEAKYYCIEGLVKLLQQH